jgi:hypothetical protein
MQDNKSASLETKARLKAGQLKTFPQACSTHSGAALDRATDSPQLALALLSSFALLHSVKTPLPSLPRKLVQRISQFFIHFHQNRLQFRISRKFRQKDFFSLHVLRRHPPPRESAVSAVTATKRRSGDKSPQLASARQASTRNGPGSLRCAAGIARSTAQLVETFEKSNNLAQFARR